MNGAIENELLDFTEVKVEQKLRELGSTLLKKNYSNNWHEDNPTYGYCYIVSEAFFHYIDNKEIHTYCLSLGEAGTHWFLKLNGKIIDFTRKQFDGEIDYSKAVRKGFFKGGVKTSKGYISKRGYEMAKHLGLIHN